MDVSNPLWVVAIFVALILTITILVKFFIACDDIRKIRNILSEYTDIGIESSEENEEDEEIVESEDKAEK